MVLLKELDETGFVMYHSQYKNEIWACEVDFRRYSNFGTSRKSQDLESNKHA